MAAEYVSMSGAIIINSASNTLKVDFGGTIETLTVPDGEYYLTGDMSFPSSIFRALKDTIETHSTGPTFTPTSITGSIINGTAAITLDWEFTLSAAATIYWEAGSTFPNAYIGKYGTEGPLSTFACAADPRAFWLADQPAESESKPIMIRDVKQNQNMDGGVFSFQKGFPHGQYSFGFSFINPERTLIATHNTLTTLGKNRTMQSFLYYAGNGDGIRVVKGTEIGSTGTVSGLDSFSAQLISNDTVPSASTQFTDWRIQAETTNIFSPARYSAGLELYGFEIGLLAKRVYS